MEIVLAVAGALLVLTGFIGSILPVLPGPPISWIGYLLLYWTHYIENARQAYINSLWILLFVVIVVTILDYVVPVLGTKKFGGSRAGVWGSTIGLIIGLFFGPLGIIIGPFLGAFLGELVSGKKEKEALRAGWGSFIGFLTGVGLKLMTCATLTFFFIRHLFF